MKAAVALLLSLTPALAHVGSPDVFYDGMAGPYRVLIVVRPPVVVPGTAQVEVHTSATGVQSVKILPMPLSGPGSQFPPTADVAVRSATDPNVFNGQLWLMAFGSWRVEVSVAGERGTGVASVPVPALATQIRGMDRSLGFVLFGLMIFLTFGIASIAAAAVRESTLAAGVESPPLFRPKTMVVMIGASVLVVFALYGGGKWWGMEAAEYGRKLYQPLKLDATVRPGNVLTLRLSDPGWLQFRKLDDLQPDHGHLMHLYAIREPDLDTVFHLHPEQVETGAFELPLPSMPAGRYKLFADIVHASGLGETPVGEMSVADPKGAPLEGDNAGGLVRVGASGSPLADGTRMVWADRPQEMRAGEVHRFVFRIEDAGGKPLADLEPYMGMAGHAAFVSHDLTTFAHIHPVGSAPMPALMLAAPADGMAAMHELPTGAEVSFPYAFPAAGKYRIIVQMKRAGKVETGAFDVDVL